MGIEKNEHAMELIKVAIAQVPFIKSAIVYGSSLLNPESRDIDVAIFIESQGGVVDSEHYDNLYNIRRDLIEATGYDIDFVPHTFDELQDSISPIFNPRYNPSMVNGKSIKGNLQVSKSLEANLKMSDFSRYVLLDNRTITRRQLCRSLKKEELSIFLSKLEHTPGNILTYRSIKSGVEYITNPSNVDDAVSILEKSCPEYEVKSFIESIRRIKKYLKDSSANYSEKDILRDARHVMRSFEKIIYLEFYAGQQPEINNSNVNKLKPENRITYK
jgi:hypothetical protein